MSHLAALVSATERIATILERIAAEHLGVNIHATTADMTGRELERHDGLDAVSEEFLAAIEELEKEGYRVPLAAYKRIGIEGPERHVDPDEPEMDVEAEPEQPVEARRRE